ncbi:NUDIX hydrolase [Sutcliffiella halmapala]|uniref:NUDIX hydrolase n=1 Tax=Sutcliffiella halmapala TaxID=79882 RepID=UPI000994914E|nr:NUDIX hydrolase [Sutcliffiella halmapala]
MDVVFKTDKAIFNYRVAGIWIEKGHVLLHKVVDDDHWSLPGGRVEIQEESQVSLKREIREELEIDINVERLVWIVENFFEYDGKDFHEIGFYFIISSDEDPLVFTENPFYGVEGKRLVFKWTPIEELRNVALYPEFLRTAINNLPMHTEQLVVKQNQEA